MKPVHEIIFWFELRPEQTNEQFLMKIDDIFFIYHPPGLSGESDSVLVDDMEYLPTRVKDQQSFSTGPPNAFALAQNYPNPFNPTTTIGFSLPQSGEVSLKVFDLGGREIRVLVDGWRQAGQHKVVFDAAGLPSGTYYYRLEADEYRQVRRMTFVR